MVQEVPYARLKQPPRGIDRRDGHLFGLQLRQNSPQAPFREVRLDKETGQVGNALPGQGGIPNGLPAVQAQAAAD